MLGGFGLLDRWGLSLLFLLAAVLHEAGHLTALWLLDISVEAIELRAGGAVIRASLRGEERELWAIAAGPAVNLLLAAVFWLPWLDFALCNLALGLGNLLPLPKRDGGRILHTLRRWQRNTKNKQRSGSVGRLPTLQDKNFEP